MSRVPSTLAVNAPLHEAIAAHRKAIADGDAELALLLLRAVVTACTPATDDIRRMLDYLTELPVEAWPAQGRDPADIRETTLAGIRRSITWQLAD